nr:16S rRNA (guanine(527)-N(7))-methyltransferase RsmG [Derxia gummosa]
MGGSSMRGQGGRKPVSAAPAKLMPVRPVSRDFDSLRPGFAARLDAAAEALGLALSPEQSARLLDYLALLSRWNSAYNLTAVRDPAEQLVLHLFDCLAVVPPLAVRLAEGDTVADIGSGGGLPGVVLAICLPRVTVHTVDAVGKKAAFVTQVKGALGLGNLHAHHSRCETLVPGRDLAPARIVVSRAFASLLDFTSLTAGLLAADGVWAAMKGIDPRDELTELASAPVRHLSTERLQVPELDAERHLLWLARAGAGVGSGGPSGGGHAGGQGA